MNEKLEQKKAKHQYLAFLNKLYHSKARNVNLAEADPLVRPCVQVSREDALACFLKNNPELERFRKTLKEIRKTHSEFAFDLELWQQAKG